MAREGTQRAHQVAQARSTKPADAQAAEPPNRSLRLAISTCVLGPWVEPPLARTTMVRKGSSDASIREAPIETTASVAQSDTVGLFATHERSSSNAGARGSSVEALACSRKARVRRLQGTERWRTPVCGYVP